MAQPRKLLWTLALIALATLVGSWTFYEVRQQKAEIETELAAQAAVLAYSLGPGLTAASNAAREIDEIIIWKLLDNARLLAEYSLSDPELPQRVEWIAEANGLDWVAYLDADGEPALVFGDEPFPDRPGPKGPIEEVRGVISGRGDEIILDPVLEDGIEHLAVAVGRPGGGAVVVRIEALAAQTYVRSLGVANLLERLVGSAGVLYLSYSEEPDGIQAQATWDGGPLPPAGDPAEGLRSVRDRSVYEVAVPLESPAGSRSSLRVGLEGSPLRRAAISAMRRSVLVGTVLAAFGFVAVAFALVTRLRGQEREQAARRLAEADVARRRSERLAAAGALTAGLAHEVRSPMNAIGLAAQRLQRRLPEGEPRRMAGSIRSEVVRLEGVLREFLELARPVSGERQPTDLARLCGEVVDLLEPEAHAEGVELESKAEAVTAEIDAEAVRRALINLVRNALQASSGDGHVVIRTTEEREAVTIAVEDRGPGIDPEIKERALEAFVTGKASGTGLGLALVRRVAEEHDGSITLENRPDGGAEARLRLSRKRS